MRYAHGLVIGKFYPLHRGHQHLVDTAAAACDRVSVVPMASSVESVPLDTRVEWLQELYADSPHVRVAGQRDDHPVDLGSDEAWALHVALIAVAVARRAIADGCPESSGIDAVFTSEGYGTELARRFGAEAVTVDLGRVQFGTSGTQVRSDPPSHWSSLSAPVRRSLARRVVVLGAESTGTTTLSLDLQAGLRERGGVWALTGWVPEIGRRWTQDMLTAAAAHRERTGEPSPSMDDLLWLEEDFEAIALAQRAAEDEAAGAGGPVLVCDTDALTTDVWFTRYLGGRSAAVGRIADGAAVPALYLLTSHVDVPFEQDGIRDGEHLRAWMSGEFRDRLAERTAATGVRVVELTGSREARLTQALAEVDAVLAAGWRLADPLPEARSSCGTDPS